jgi:hypothetical protein
MLQVARTKSHLDPGHQCSHGIKKFENFFLLKKSNKIINVGNDVSQMFHSLSYTIMKKSDFFLDI